MFNINWFLKPKYLHGSRFFIIVLMFFNVRSTLSGSICANDSSLICDSQCLHMASFLDKSNKELGGWNERHPTIASTFLAQKVNISIEIGVAYGGLSRYLLDHIPYLIHHGVDPFIGGYDKRDIMSKTLKKVNNHKTWSDSLLYNLRDVGCRFQLHKGLSTEVVGDFLPNSVDVVFIDGDHRYEGVVADIKAYANIVRPGGMLMFDDYNVWFPGVRKAVDEFCLANGFKFVTVNENDVYIIKPFDKPLITI